MFVNCTQHLFNPEWIMVGIVVVLGAVAVIALFGLARAVIKM
jgi:hypothetical protein